MDLLKKRIVDEGAILPGGIIRVDSFLNHQIDPMLMQAMAKEFASRFADAGITKVLTIEASGIAVAVLTALEFGVPLVFAKKQASKNMQGNSVCARVKSYTKGTESDVVVCSDYITPDDRVLIVDDFLAMGEAVRGLIQLVDQSNAELAGVGILIEKGFQPGGKQLREQGIRLESLAIVESTDHGVIHFRD